MRYTNRRLLYFTLLYSRNENECRVICFNLVCLFVCLLLKAATTTSTTSTTTTTIPTTTTSMRPIATTTATATTTKPTTATVAPMTRTTISSTATTTSTRPATTEDPTTSTPFAGIGCSNASNSHPISSQFLQHYKIYKLTLTVSSLWQWYRQFWVAVADGFLQCVRSNWLCATVTESCPMFVFSVFVGEFLAESSSRKCFIFLQVLIKILFSELKIIPIFHVIASSLRTMYLDGVNVARSQCDAVMTSSVR